MENRYYFDINLYRSVSRFYVFLGPPIDPTLIQPAHYSYPDSAQNSCQNTESSGKAGVVDDIETAEGASYNLRTPSRYNSAMAHPLIVVFSPAGTSAKKYERHVHLTKEATEAGYIIAYAANIRLSLEAIDKLSSVPKDIEKNGVSIHLGFTTPVTQMVAQLLMLSLFYLLLRQNRRL